MHGMCDFHIDFQFWTKKSHPRDFQMDLATPWQLKWHGILDMAHFGPEPFPRQCLCIYPCVDMCCLVLRPYYFSKNQATGGS